MTKVYRHQEKDQKRGSAHPKSDRVFEQGVLSQGLNRRALLKTGIHLPLVSVLAACQQEPNANNELAPITAKKVEHVEIANQFNSKETLVIQAVQQHLLPDDGDGPDAKNINAFDYLNFAMTDQQNIEDGDLEFIKKGVGWLTDLSESTQGDDFLNLTNSKQASLLTQIAASSAGENWLSILMYYLTEALMLDPIYGGNPNGAGWKWLEHQAGFPRPIAGKTYRDFK